MEDENGHQMNSITHNLLNDEENAQFFVATLARFLQIKYNRSLLKTYKNFITTYIPF